jgi:hypothetical protein
MIRACTHEDLEEIRRIHELYYKDEFDLPDFMNYLSAFVIEDEKGIITIGGVRDIVECTALTDKSRHPIDRFRALKLLLDASTFASRSWKYDQMFIWSQDSKYSRRLTKNGFRFAPGQSLIYDL